MAATEHGAHCPAAWGSVTRVGGRGARGGSGACSGVCGRGVCVCARGGGGHQGAAPLASGWGGEQRDKDCGGSWGQRCARLCVLWKSPEEHCTGRPAPPAAPACGMLQPLCTSITGRQASVVNARRLRPGGPCVCLVADLCLRALGQGVREAGEGTWGQQHGRWLCQRM